MSATLRIATRQSALALWQAEHVAQRLRCLHPGLQVQLRPMTTRGDEVLDRSLAELGGKGLFLKELEISMQEGRADLAVHSLKDVPVDLEPGFTLAAILSRADMSDALVSVQYPHLQALPHGACVGTSSLRRQAQLRALRPDLQLRGLRGNVNTRLARLEAGDYDAIILAAAGLERLGLAAAIRERLVPPDWLPAPGQGAIAIEARSTDTGTMQWLQALDDPETRCTVGAERAFNATLGGNCSVPVGAYAILGEQNLHLHGLVGDAQTGKLVRGDIAGSIQQAEQLGRSLAEELLDRGARELLAAAVPPQLAEN